MKKRATVFLVLCLIGSLLCSCGKTSDTDADAVSSDSSFSVVENGETDFIIVRPQGDSDANALAVKLVKAYKAQWNVSMTNCSDEEARSEGTPEIIIGNTSRPESAEALRMLYEKSGKAKEFIICVKNGNIVINSADPDNLSAAVDRFIEVYMSASAINTELCDLQLDSASYNTLKVNGEVRKGPYTVSLCGYSDSFLVKTELERLKTAIVERLGYLVLSTDGTDADIIIGNASGGAETAETREDYEIKLSQGRIYIDGGSDYALSAGITELANDINSGNVEFSDGVYRSGKYRETVSGYAPDSYRQLVWNHEFEVSNTDELSTHFINTHDHMSSKDSNLVTSSSSENFFIMGDNMVLRITSDGNRNYTTARSVSTATKMAFRYGYVEMRAIVPYQKCVWPSFWMKPASNLKQSAYSGEIDIFEIFSSTDTVVPNLHKWYNGDSDQIENRGNVLFGQRKFIFNDTTDLNSTYHIYGFEWTPEYMAFYVDGEMYYKVGITENDDYSEERPGMDCFHDYYYLCFNNWVYTDQQAWADLSLHVENNPDFGTVDYVIDYVRLYQTTEESIAIDYAD